MYAVSIFVILSYVKGNKLKNNKVKTFHSCSIYFLFPYLRIKVTEDILIKIILRNKQYFHPNPELLKSFLDQKLRSHLKSGATVVNFIR